jgi:CRP-like cAMP-binding protein
MAGTSILALDFGNLFKRVSAHTTTRDYRNREAIFAQGDKADAMFYVKKGHVKLTVVSTNGKKAVIAILHLGNFFGEGCLNGQSLRMSTATSIQPSTIARVKRATLVRLIRQDPAFAKLFIANLLSRIARVEESFVDQIFSSSEQRLAKVLLLLAGYGLQSSPEPHPVKVSQETLAEMVGTTRSRVSHFMNHFREMGFIDYNGSLRVHRSLLTYLQR